MKKSQQNLLQRLGEKISEEKFQNHNSKYAFSEKFESDKKGLLNKIAINEAIKKSKKRKMLIAAACTVIILVPCSALAANKVMSTFKVTKEQTDPYAYQINFEEETLTAENAVTAVTEIATKSELFHSDVKLEYGYIPQGFTSGSSGCKFALNGDFYSNQNFSVLIDKIHPEKPLSFLDVVQTTDLTIGHNKATLLHKNYTDLTSYSKILLVYYDEYGYYIEIFAQTAVPDAELLKIAENITLASCSKEDSDIPVHPEDIPWVKALMDSAKAKAAATAATAPDIQEAATSSNETTITFGTLDESKFLSIRKSFQGLTYSNASFINSPDITYTVQNVEVKDSIASLNASSFSNNYNEIKQLVDANGNLKPFVQNEINKGDGKTSVDTVVGQTTSNLKLVYVTMKLKNTTNNVVSTVDIIPKICCLANTNGILSLPDVYTTKAINDYGGSVYCDHPSRYDENPSDTSAPPIYLKQTYNIQPNAEFEYHVAYIVDASKMNNMVLFFNPQQNTISTTSNLQTIIKLY